MYPALPLLFLLFFTSLVSALDLSESILNGEFWQQDPQKAFTGLRYTQPDAQHLRLLNVSLGETVASEVVINLTDDGKPGSLQALLYNKGDDLGISDKEFHSLQEQTLKQIEQLTHKRPRYMGGGKRGGAIKLKAWQWNWENGVILLESSSDGSGRRFEGEFIRLRIAPDEKSLRKGSSRDNIHKKELLQHVVREEDGTVWIKDIPMVDQGQKGYCSVATFARVFAFYGMESVDQHVLANLCETGEGGGTPINATIDAMDRISHKYHTKFIVIDNYSENIQALLKPYNKLAKKHDKPLVSAYTIYNDLHYPFLKEIYTKKKTETTKWVKDMAKYIDNGYPVIWLIWYNSKESPTHIRMITGYNLKNQTIVYSDSWGAAHARKIMSATEARGITLGRYILKLR